MNFSKAIDIIFKNNIEGISFRDQLEAVSYYALYDYDTEVDTHYHSLKYLPRRLEAAAMKMFMINDVTGYRAELVRLGLRYLEEYGSIEENIPAKSSVEIANEVYGWVSLYGGLND